MQLFQILEWDSKILGVNVARILSHRLCFSELAAILDELRQHKVTLVYWAADSNCQDSSLAARQGKGLLVDRKVTYCCRLSDYNGKFLVDDARIQHHIPEEYPQHQPCEELVRLAYLSGSYSRFKQDPQITSQQFKTIYRLWITNSVNKQIADSVQIIKIHNKITGMITLGQKQGRGDIGLLAVDPAFQGLKIGTALMAAAYQYFTARYQWAQVVTQAENIPACRLYESCGYSIEKVENFYHFWL